MWFSVMDPDVVASCSPFHEPQMRIPTRVVGVRYFGHCGHGAVEVKDRVWEVVPWLESVGLSARVISACVSTRASCPRSLTRSGPDASVWRSVISPPMRMNLYRCEDACGQGAAGLIGVPPGLGAVEVIPNA